ncbi:uncharacterized protein LOC105629045 [Jatropha curcas]|uniref:uncharacterized protein LOC105629045 n=1 Tax=Jatropha curcas TaxID=180498 RepID=UPI0005FB2FFB|nr:uncharacterized protein LOC105629045 [Jatropha curcas]
MVQGIGSNPSCVWGSIHGAIPLIKSKIVKKVGNVDSISIWDDAWLLDVDIPKSLEDCWLWLEDKSEYLVGIEYSSKNQKFAMEEANDCIPIRSRFQARRLEVTDSCPVCGLPAEFLLHLLVDCSFARDCWSCSVPGVVDIVDLQMDVSFQDWLLNTVRVLTASYLEFFFLVTWIIWRNRNQVLWTWVRSSIHHLLSSSKDWFMAWQAAQLRRSSQVKHGPHVSTVWSLPSAGYFKCNFDAALRPNSSQMGAGWVLRDADGLLLHTCQVLIRGSYCPQVAETLSFREALNWIKGKSCANVVFESDSQLLVQAKQRRAVENSYFMSIVLDCRLLYKN